MAIQPSVVTNLDLWLAVCDFLLPKEVCRVASVCRHLRLAADNDLLWHDLYKRVQRWDGGIDAWAQRLADKPRGREAVGRAVLVWDEEREIWRGGVILEFEEALGFRVRYADCGDTRWEKEVRSQGRWHTRGKSRIEFLDDGPPWSSQQPSGLSKDIAEGGAGSSGGGGSGGGSSSNPPWRPIKGVEPGSAAAAVADVTAASVSSSSDVPGGEAAAAVRFAEEWLPRRGDWKQQLMADTRHVPRTCAAVLRDHRDEVLDLAFSHDGRHLASCSRDFYIYIYRIGIGADARPPPSPLYLQPQALQPQQERPQPQQQQPQQQRPHQQLPQQQQKQQRQRQEEEEEDWEQQQERQPPQQRQQQRQQQQQQKEVERRQQQDLEKNEGPTRHGAAAAAAVPEALSEGEAAAHAAAVGPWTFQRVQALRSEPLSCFCRVKWSPCDRFILSCLEEPQGNPFGHLSCVELWDAFRGRCLMRLPSTPFDMHCDWTPDGRLLLSSRNIQALGDHGIPGGGGGNFFGYRQVVGVWARPELPDESRAASAAPAPLAPGQGQHGGIELGLGEMVAGAAAAAFVGAAAVDAAAAAANSAVASGGAGDNALMLEDGADSDSEMSEAGAEDAEDGLEADPEPALRGEIELYFRGVNFAHFLNVSHDGRWLCFATGDNPFLCHRVCILEVGCSLVQGRRRVEVETLETCETEGAVLSIGISRDDRLLLVNVRRFSSPEVWRAYRKMSRAEALQGTAPDIESAVELQVWDVATRQRLWSMRGAHAFTTKDCPFLLFSAQSRADPAGNYVSSGSEEHAVYIWHLRHRRLLRVLKGHEDVVSSTSWNPAIPGMLATASDDHTVRIWAPSCYVGDCSDSGRGSGGSCSSGAAAADVASMSDVAAAAAFMAVTSGMGGAAAV